MVKKTEKTAGKSRRMAEGADRKGNLQEAVKEK
jgi:hypothetical protein